MALERPRLARRQRARRLHRPACRSAPSCSARPTASRACSQSHPKSKRRPNGTSIGPKHEYRLLLGLAFLAFLALASTAFGIKLRAGDIIVYADGGFTPTKLPQYEDAPITIHGGIKIDTVSGDLPPTGHDRGRIRPPRLGRHDRASHLQSSQLEATTVEQARQKCAGAIVGGGSGSAIVKFEEQNPIKASTPLTIFNGPEKNGNPTVLAHAYLTQPIVTTFVVPVVIEKINKGLYGYRTKATIPKIAKRAGIPMSGSLRIGKQWTYKGERHSYVNARCETGRLQARGQATFKDGTYLVGTFLRPCQVRR